MFVRGMAGAALAFLIVSAAQAASDDNLADSVLACSALVGDQAQLACYNRIAAQLKAPAVAQAPAIAAPSPPPPPPAANKPADFGKDTMPFQADAAAPEQITARVRSVIYSYFHVFTVTLDNGQVWRQVDGDTRVARFKNDKTEVVTITRGFLDSFHLAIKGDWGAYEVKRIK